MIRFFLRFKWFRKWIETAPDVELDKSRLSLKIKLGLFLIFFSFVVGWGGPFVAGILAISFQSAKIILLYGAILYFSSWGIWAIGMYLTGKANYEYAQFFLAKYIKNKYSLNQSTGINHNSN